MPSAKSLTGLPQLPETWLVAVRSLNAWITPEGEPPVRPNLVLVVRPDQMLLLGSEIFPQPPDNQQILEQITQAIRKPEKTAHQKPHRPQTIQFERADLVDRLAPQLEKLGIASGSREPFQEIDKFLEEFGSFLEGEKPVLPGLLSAAGNTPELVGRVFAAAAAFYRAAPWQYLSDGQPLALEVYPPGRQGFVQIMGNAGLQFGLMFYWNWEDVLQSYEMTDENPLEHIPASGWNSFTFENGEMLAFADLDAIEQHGWEIAGPNAYPLPVIYFADDLQRPGREALEFYEAALRAIPHFVSQLQFHDQEEAEYQSLEMAVPVETSLGPVTVTLRYPAGDLPAAIFLDDEDLLDLFDDYEEEDGEDELLFDERALEEELLMMSQELGRVAARPSPFSPQTFQAQKLVYLAFAEPEPEKRVQMARQALEISPDCADAYVLLAEEEAETPEEAYKFYEQGAQAGERALGKDFIQRNSGSFWTIPETRGYMRARQGLAESLEYLERPADAIPHYEALLRLDPDDNQGNRYHLLNLLVRLEKNEAAEMLLGQYDQDPSAIWAYSRALLAFRRRGPSAQADAALRRAVRQNPHVPAYLSGARPLTQEIPEEFEYGDDDEAVDYASEHFGNWWHTRGAVPWLKEITQDAKKSRPAKDKRKRR